MITEKLRVLGFGTKSDYMIVEELWKVTENDKPTKIKAAYTCENRDYIGSPKDAKFLARKGITKFEKVSPENCVVSIGFNPKEQKWYGWSHRAIYGFGIGSKVKKGDCGYRAATPQELFEDVTKIEKYEDGWEYQWLKPENVSLSDDGIIIRTKMSEPKFNEKGEFVGYGEAPDNIREMKCGKGEWEAKTLEDAKQMAIDFAKSVS